MSVVGESSHQPYPMFDDGYGGHGHGQQNDGSGGYGYHDPYGGGVYSQGGGRNDMEERGLVGDAAGMAGRPTSQYSPLESSVPPHALEGADGMGPGQGGDLEDQQTKSRGAPYGGMRECPSFPFSSTVTYRLMGESRLRRRQHRVRESEPQDAVPRELWHRSGQVSVRAAD